MKFDPANRSLMIRASLVALAAISLPLSGHDVITTKITWSREVSRIVYKRCASCHRDGGPAFSLMTYQESRPWVVAIKEQVLTRRMPPWNAVKGFGEFKNDRGLTQEEIEIIGEWVEGGAPEGNPLYMPAVPRFSAEEPDAERRLATIRAARLSRTVDAVGIRATHIPANGVLQAIARRPDGSIEPLLWIQKFNPDYNGTYYFRNALRLPAGTKIEVTPETAAVFLLVRRQPANRHATL